MRQLFHKAWCTLRILGHSFVGNLSYLTTFNTQFSQYRFLRLPFGLNCSQDLFQSKIDECLEGMEGVVTIVDDIVVFRLSHAEHDRNLREVLRVTEK